MDAKLRESIKFFAEHAGYSTPPGRMACAKSLAVAEAEAERRGWIFEWRDDDDPDTSWMDGSETASYIERSYFLSCALRAPDEDGTILASLWGIHFLQGGPQNTQHRKDYGRVIEAELACEALDAEERTRREDARAIAACAL